MQEMSDDPRERGGEWRLGVIPSLRARAARYRDHAAHFARLAEAEPVERIRDQWKELARNFAYLANTLVEDGGRASGHYRALKRPASSPV
jgi:hypothetical protein